MKNVLKAVAFLLVGVILIGGVSQVICGKWMDANKETYTTKEFYDLKDNSIEVFIVGSSQIVTGVSSMTMYENYGISAFGLGTGNAPMAGNYHWLKECEKTQDISMVAIEVSMLYEPTKQFLFRRAFDPMKLSRNKLEAVYEQSRAYDGDSVLSYVFPMIKYHDRWKELTEEDFVFHEEDSLVYRGNVMKSGVKPVPYEKVIIDNDALRDIEMEAEQLEYFEKILSYCKESGWDVVLFKTPKTSWSLSKSEGVKALAEQYGVPFLDFNYDKLMKEIKFDPMRDLRDADHPNLRGAEKISDYLGKYLQENYDLKDYRQDGIDPVNMQLYHEDREDCYLKMSTEPMEYLENLNNDRYGVIVQLTGDISESWNGAVQEKFAALGFKTDISAISGRNYVGVIERGNCVFEEAVVGPLDYSGSFDGRIDYTAWSDIMYDEDDVKMEVAGEEEFFDEKGMNILVYDIAKGRILSEVAIKKQADSEDLELETVYLFE